MSGVSYSSKGRPPPETYGKRFAEVFIDDAIEAMSGEGVTDRRHLGDWLDVALLEHLRSVTGVMTPDLWAWRMTCEALDELRIFEGRVGIAFWILEKALPNAAPWAAAT